MHIEEALAIPSADLLANKKKGCTRTAFLLESPVFSAVEKFTNMTKMFLLKTEGEQNNL